MGKNKTTRKDSMIDLLVVAIVVVTMSLLVIQLGMDTLNTFEQSSIAHTPTPAAIQSPTPAEPTPTFDISSIEIQD